MRTNGRTSAALSTEQTCIFGMFVQTLWPHKTAVHLSQRLGCSEREAYYLINGQRRVTAKAAHLILTEMLRNA
jgi:hypothetical protein